MDIIVQKYGGTSLGDVKCLRRVANRIRTYYVQNKKLVVILSAMGHSTDKLVQLARSIHTSPEGRSMDMLLSTGEQVSISLMAMALERLGIPATPFTGAQAGICAKGKHTQAYIHSIDTKFIHKELGKNRVCLVAGFQGVNEEGETLTLGRGGSDTSAVALAAALQAKLCEIFTDVDGIYTADPNKVTTARRLKQISYEEMLEMARLGSGVLHSRSVELASKNSVALHVRSSFNNKIGSFVVSEEQVLEKALVRGISLKSDEARISLFDIADRPGLAARLFAKLKEKDININMIVQSSGHNELNTISFTLLQEQIDLGKSIVQEFVNETGSGQIEVIPEIAIVSVVGVGMRSHSGVAASIFQALADIEANIEMISTSEIKISVVLRPNQGHRALEAVHQALGLDKKL